MLGRSRLAWERDGADWPNRAQSDFVSAAGLKWHVQREGRGPQALLIHGTGASTHSWRDLSPILAEDFTVIAPDLPGHGFTDRPASFRLSLNGMAESLAGLLRSLELDPVVVVGHSAGAPIAARMCLDGKITPKLVVSINGAWLPFRGASGVLFPLMARALFLNPLTPRVFATLADRGRVARLIRQTGSDLDEAGIALYQRLLRSPSHVAGALGMMANWNLEPLNRDLRRLAPELLLIVGESDLAIPPATAEKVGRMVPKAEVRRLPGLGHLAHEEAPETVAGTILDAARALDLLSDD
ncbi:MAG: alpha/beta fold hydrolase [Kiloniellales bacterium]|nr:alpha/beta fold hydrolase [Kiloniellales bacterium]